MFLYNANIDQNQRKRRHTESVLKGEMSTSSLTKKEDESQVEENGLGLSDVSKKKKEVENLTEGNMLLHSRV